MRKMTIVQLLLVSGCVCKLYVKSTAQHDSNVIQEGLAVASIARDDPSTLPGDNPFPRARMHRDRNAR